MRKWLVTFFGAGMAPIAPGTFGSLLCSVVLFAIFALSGGIVSWVWQVVLFVGLLVSGIVAIILGPWAVGFYGREDPPAFVLDEVAGICLSNLFLPIQTGWRQGWVIGIAFVMFRLFDITKIPPARQLENLPDGWGILFDDLAAAVYANVCCQLLLRFVLPLH